MAFRFFHTADWHLGQTFHEYDRDHEHGRFLEWFLDCLIQKQPDALLLAGDVFDTINPSAVAQRRFYAFLGQVRMSLPGLQIVITAGNHDAGSRLEAPSALLDSLNIHLVGTIQKTVDGEILLDRMIVPLRETSGTVKALALAVPYLRPSDVPVVANASDPYLEGVRALYHGLTQRARLLRDEQYPGAALIALGHCHMAGANESRDSERRLIIGGNEALRPDSFPPDLAYVALGHLHKPQSIDGGRIRYCGSPIPLSFSELDYPHQVLLCTLDPSKGLAVEPLPIPKTAHLIRIPKSGAAKMDEVLRRIGEIGADPAVPLGEQPFLEVNVVNDGPDPSRRHRIEQELIGKGVRLAVIRQHQPAEATPPIHSETGAPQVLADLSTLDPESLLQDAFREKYRTDLPQELLVALRELLATEAADSTAS